jgi:hypothetical protein
VRSAFSERSLGSGSSLRISGRDDHPGRMVAFRKTWRGRGAAEEESEAEREARRLPKNIDFLNGESSSCR